MIEVYTEVTFEAAHHLPNVPNWHQCKRLHGHSYKVRVVAEGELNEQGWVVDFYDMEVIVLEALSIIDHKYLNEVAGLENPTCENVAIWLWNDIKPQLPELSAIHLSESTNTGCIYRGS